MSSATPQKRPGLRPTLLWLHRWAGIVTGLVVVIVCVTGTILAFEDEYRIWQNPQRYQGSTAGWPQDPSVLLDQALVGEEGYRATSLSLYPGTEAPASVGLRGDDLPSKTVYLHGDGTVIERVESSRDLMSWTMRVHRGFVGGDFGRAVVGISTIVFLLILITAVPLWWPKTRARLRQSVSVKWNNANWTRRIYDLHVSLGFWSLALLFVIGITGLPFGYRWAGNALYVLTASPPAPTAPSSSSAPPLSDGEEAEQGAVQAADLNRILNGLRSEVGLPRRVAVSLPSQADGAIRIRVYPADAAHESVSDAYYFDRYDGALLDVHPHAELPTGAKLRRAVFPAHVGNFWGLPSKIIWGFASLLGATFPVTGCLMWYRRRRRTLRREDAQAPAAESADQLAASKTTVTVTS